MNEDLSKAIYQVIQQYPWYGLDRIHHQLKMQGRVVNRKAVHRILKLKGWTLRERPSGKRPRVRGMISQTHESNTRWAIDTTHLMTEESGWSHVTMVVDCCDREIVGWRISSSGKAKIAMAALEDALMKRRPQSLTLRSDNGLVFGSKAFVGLCRKWDTTRIHHTLHTGAKWSCRTTF